MLRRDPEVRPDAPAAAPFVERRRGYTPDGIPEAVLDIARHSSVCRIAILALSLVAILAVYVNHT